MAEKALGVDSLSSTTVRSLGDSFAIGVIVMLLVNVLQRSIGLLRGIGFAHFLTDVELGQWALANSFFVIAVPIAVAGMPGSFGRFVEHFRRRNQLGDYFRLVLGVSLAGSALIVALIAILPGAFTWIVFGASTTTGVIVWTAATLVSAIVFSFTTELAGAFRQVRTVSTMYFVQSLSFALLGLCTVGITGSWWVLLPSFAVANLLGCLPGCWCLLRQHGQEFKPQKSIPGLQIARRIAPYAASLWLVNLFGNLFEVGDRYMLLHLIERGNMTADPTIGQALNSAHGGQAAVGQYHCARILPNLLTSLAVTLGGVLLPYLSADWEGGHHERIRARVRQMIQGICIGFLGLSTAALAVAPFLFESVFDNRYAEAYSVLPLALLQATWVALFLVSEPYMLCIERGKQLAYLIAAALAINLGLNWLLIQSLGLTGALIATSTANFLGLMLLFRSMSANGCRIDAATVTLCFCPMVILGGPIVSMLTLVLLVMVAGRTDWILSAQDRADIDQAILPKLAKLGVRLDSLWPNNSDMR